MVYKFIFRLNRRISHVKTVIYIYHLQSLCVHTQVIGHKTWEIIIPKGLILIMGQDLEQSHTNKKFYSKAICKVPGHH